MFSTIEKGYYEVYVNNIKVSQHSKVNKANDRAKEEWIKEYQKDSSKIPNVEVRQPKLKQKIDMDLLFNLINYYSENNNNNNRPTLSNFRIENTNPDRVLFDASKVITATTVNGFNIEGKTITGITIDGDGLGGYFTVSTPFTWWDNNYITYFGNNSLPWITGNTASDLQDASGNTLFDMTPEYIQNNIAEPTASGTVYYVTTTGSSANDGLSEVNAWTLEHALTTAVGGDIIYVKAGSYFPTDHVEITTSGTPTNPLKIIGYKTDPVLANNNESDITSNYYTYTAGLTAPTYDDTEMPTIDGNNLAKYALWIAGFDNIIIKNIQITQMLLGVATTLASENIHVERVNTFEMYGSGAQEGTGFSMLNNNSGGAWVDTKFRIKDCIAINSGASAMSMYGKHNLMIDNKAYNDNTQTGSIYGTDYYMNLTGDYNIMYNCVMETMDNTVNSSSHGASARGASWDDGHSGSTTQHNLFQNLTIKTGSKEAIQSRNPLTYYNYWKGITMQGFGTTIDDGSAISNQTGSRFNLYENLDIKDMYSVFYYQTGAEANVNNNPPTAASVMQEGCIYRNIKVDNAFVFFWLSNSQLSVNIEIKDMKFYNITMNNADIFMRGQAGGATWTFSGNEMVNCVINDVPDDQFATDPPYYTTFFQTIEYNDIWNYWGTNGTPLTGTGNISIDPQLGVDLVPSNTGLNVGIDLSLIDYDINGVQRKGSNQNTLGAIEISN